MPDNSPANLMLFFGRLHPLLVHLPIGFLAILAVLELANRVRHVKHAAQARSVVLFLTVLASIVAVTCGLMLASAGGYDPQLLFWHKWMGIALAAATILTAVSFWSKRHRLYVGCLMITLLLLGPASHFGGSMTHGKDYLTAYAPTWMRTMLGTRAMTPTTRPHITDATRAVMFSDVVQPMLAQHCLSCHNADKFKGQLRLDSYDALAKGGASGASFVAGDPEKSLLVQRLMLPEEDSKHMPPTGMSQLSDDQFALLRWWIESGASPEKTVAELDPPVKILDAVSSALGIAPTTQPAAPGSLDVIRSNIVQLEAKLGVVIDPVAIDQPWVDVNASVPKKFGDAELAQLAPIALNITSLNLSGTQVSDAGLAMIEQMPNLKRLRLENTAVTDVGLAHLAKLRKLEYLNLYGTGITNAGLKSLERIPSLRQVYLWRTKVEPDAAKAFAESKIDRVKIQRWQQQIATLQKRVDAEVVEVFYGVKPTTTTAPTNTTAPTTTTAPTSTTAPTTTTAPATTQPK